MNRDKQIKEMTNVYEEARTKSIETLGSMNEGAGVWYAKAFYTAGYRKASDVAREVIDEINDSFDQMVNEAENTIMDAIQEGNLTAARIARYGKDVIILARNTLTKMLEKKYTEGEG